MELFDVYPLFNINIVKGKGCHVWDENNTEYLDLYGGHAVISIGHAHPHYVEAISNQVAQLGFYSNSVINKLQQQLAERLGKACGYEDYSLFLINSGAEANENALKLASFHNGRTRVVSFSKAFHGRTSLAVEATNNPKIIAPVNANSHVTFLELNDIEGAKAELEKGDVCAVIIEGIQGVGGIRIPEPAFLKALRELCDQTGTVLILDEIQSGYGRSGKFFAHQHAGIRHIEIPPSIFRALLHPRVEPLPTPLFVNREMARLRSPKPRKPIPVRIQPVEQPFTRCIPVPAVLIVDMDTVQPSAFLRSKCLDNLFIGPAIVRTFIFFAIFRAVDIIPMTM